MIRSGIALLCLLLLPSSYAANSLVVLNWPDYLPKQVIDDFQKEYNVDVSMVYYESDEIKDYLLSANDGQNYDVVISSLFRTQNYRNRAWLQKIDQSKIPNLQHIEERWLAHYHTTDQTCVPYLWGTLGILYNTQSVNTDITSWQQFYSPHLQTKQKIKLLSDSRDVLATALIALGYSVNIQDIKQVRQAGRLLYNRMNNVASFGALELNKNSELIQNKISMAMAYNGDGLYLSELDPRLKYVVPNEGTPLWLDCLTIMQKSNNKLSAYQFVNYLHEPKVAASISEALFYATPNKSAKQFLSADILNNKQVYLSESVLEKSEFYQQLPAQMQREYQTIFSQLSFILDKEQ
ncbi:hypothetical protein C2869_00415 [Saccharobesus litoralis]|uniref:Putrescine-binding periplasmic protein n=1 Tax=Saccharobesus litoralis TaxID=2172099 RepID=A0A2S0VLA3_9ALTE|nr:spermidine/putrescine ABC transporter substrate-binding protein [Saccharobesus litoralis]AWB64994.1 hypothetical protein C2869_00415 [Saccharobesus litoralis]